jgi:glutamyl-tRNA synthetase
MTDRRQTARQPGPSGLRGRYAPSPTGELHLGNASTALLAWLSVRARDGTYVMRTEDLDAGRARPGLADQILRDLDWLGLDWDEGPDIGGDWGPYVQSERAGGYARAFERLKQAGHVYPCFCSRRDIAAAASAPQEPGDERRYPGTCREIDPAEAARRVAAGERHAWRFRVQASEGREFVDIVRGRVVHERPAGDFVVQRSDGVPAYQLAVVVDDHAMGITEVVRGDDLLGSTAWQLMLFDALAFDPPAIGHVPLLLGTDRVRLSKRHRGITIRELRESGRDSREIVGRLAELIGLRPVPERIEARELVGDFELSRVRAAGGGIVVDPAGWD